MPSSRLAKSDQSSTLADWMPKYPNPIIVITRPLSRLLWNVLPMVCVPKGICIDRHTAEKNVI
jgi:hypothetical protein